MAEHNGTPRSIPHTSIAERFITTTVVEAIRTYVNNVEALVAHCKRDVFIYRK